MRECRADCAVGSLDVTHLVEAAERRRASISFCRKLEKNG